VIEKGGSVVRSDNMKRNKLLETWDTRGEGCMRARVGWGRSMTT